LGLLSAAAEDEVEEELSDLQRQMIERTADWLVKHPDKSHVILETSKNNPKFRCALGLYKIGAHQY
jgi:hypothetical protein